MRGITFRTFQAVGKFLDTRGSDLKNCVHKRTVRKKDIDTDKEQECVNALLQSQNYNRVHIFLALPI